jgi:hypothetical protein
MLSLPAGRNHFRHVHPVSNSSFPANTVFARLASCKPALSQLYLQVAVRSWPWLEHSAELAAIVGIALG